MTTRRAYWATIRTDPERTRDVLLQACSEWSAWWLARQLHPRADVLAVRPASRSVPVPGRPYP